MENLTLYIHIIFASIWIGGMIILISFGIYIRDNEKFKYDFFNIFGTFYGWLNVIVLIMLILTGICLITKNGLYSTLFSVPLLNITKILWMKIFFVSLTLICTIIHSCIVLRVPIKNRTKTIKIINRTCSLFLFISSFFLLYFGMSLRNFL